MMVMADGTEEYGDDWERRFYEKCEPKRDHNAAVLRKALISRGASDIVPEKVEWLWPGRLARGKHTCIAGEPGTGKSQLSVAIIAAVTTGGEWPCGEGRSLAAGNVIILSAEDGAADTIVPRLIAAGADLARVEIVSAVGSADGKDRRTFNLQTDIALLEKKIAEIGDVALVVVDPVSSYLGKADSHKNSEVRGVLEPLGEMADRTRVAVLTITHFSKTGAGNTTKALHRFIGSIAFTGAPRTAFAVIEDADSEGRYLFLHAKNNLAAPPQGLAYRLEQTIIAEGIPASRVWWETAPVSITANQALAADAGGVEQRSALAEAEEFLCDLLGAGPVPAKQGEEDARALGVAPKTLKRARKKLNVVAEKGGMEEGWTWRLPAEGGQPPPKGAKVFGWPSSEGLAPFGTEECQPPNGGGDSDLPVCEQCGRPGRDAPPFAYGEFAAEALHPHCRHDWLVARGADLDLPATLRRSQ